MLLEVKDLNKSYGEKQVLKGINLSVQSGQALGLLGRNGAGKSTTIRILMDLFPANSGEILLDGKPINHDAVSKGYLPEERGLYTKKKIFEQLVYLAELKGMKKADAKASVSRWLKKIGMDEYKNARLDTLSKGNQQKIQLITAVAHDPEIVILDEPFSGLDPVNAKVLENVVKSQIDAGKIVLFSSHQMNYIEEFCNNIAILHNGKIALSGDIRDIKRGYKRDRLIIESPDADKILAAFGDKAKKRESGDIILKMDSEDDKQRTMQQLSSDYEIDSMKVFEPTLNDIFVEYTDGKEEVKIGEEETV